MQATYVTSNFLVDTLKKAEETGEINFNNAFNIPHYIQNVISTCNQYKIH